MKLKAIQFICFFLLPCLAFADLDELLQPLPEEVTNERAQWVSPVMAQLEEAQAPAPSQPVVLQETKPRVAVPELARPLEESVETAKQVAETPARRVLVSTADVLPLLQQLIARRYNIEGDLEMIPAKEWSGLHVSSEAWEVEMVRYPSQGLNSRMVLHFRILCDGIGEAEVHLPVLARVMTDGLVSSRQINRGEPLSFDDFRIEEMDLLEMRSQPVTADILISSYEASVSIAPGRPLTWRDISERPLVRKGQVIDVSANEGLLSISLKGVALENGAQGAFIRVRNLNSNKEFQAQVINEKRVQVYF